MPPPCCSHHMFPPTCQIPCSTKMTSRTSLHLDGPNRRRMTSGTPRAYPPNSSLCGTAARIRRHAEVPPSQGRAVSLWPALQNSENPRCSYWRRRCKRRNEVLQGLGGGPEETH